MRLHEITIENFRGLKHLSVSLGQVTVLIGENNAGKSTVLEALRAVLARGGAGKRNFRFSDYDFHLSDGDASPQNAEPIQIILHFAEDGPDEWELSIVEQLGDVLHPDPTGITHLWVRVTGFFDQTSGIFETQWAFLDPAGQELRLKSFNAFAILSRFVPLFFLSALRDATQEFGQRGQFWSGFLKSIQLPDDQRERIEEMLTEINTSVIEANAGLTEVTRKISETGRLIPLHRSDPVRLEAIPTKVFDMMGKIQVHLKSEDGAKLPLHKHGEGTQSLAVLMLFQAFVTSNLAEAYSPESQPILALEEPEAHLHPAAVRSLGTLLGTLTGQVLVTSHSGDLLSRVPVNAIRRIYKRNGETRVGMINPSDFTARELQAIDYTVRLSKGHFLFSRCWLFVEGESDFHFMPMLFDLVGYSQDQVSFSVLEISQVYEKGEPLIKLAKALGIEWFLLADGDPAGDGYVQRAAKHLSMGENLEDRARRLAHSDVEHEFWHGGYEAFIRSLIPKARLRETEQQFSDKDEAETVKGLIKAAIREVGGKPAFAQELIGEIRRRGAAGIPDTIQNAIRRVTELSAGRENE